MPLAVLAGIGWHFLGAAFAASFYAPIGKVKHWSWETTWALMGFFSWILLPLSLCYLVLPNFHAFYASFDPKILLTVALFGAMWGVGNVSYGLTMRHLGISLRQQHHRRQPADADIAMNATGSFVVSWSTDNQDIYAQQFNADGTMLGNEFQVNTTTADQAYERSTPFPARERTLAISRIKGNSPRKKSTAT